MTRSAPLTLATVLALGMAATAKADISACNDFHARIRIALAYEDQGAFASAGWWSIEPNACRDVDFAFKGAKLYYAANSDKYKEGRSTKRDHWGNKKQLFVPSKDFRIDNADAKRRGAQAQMFSLIELSEQQQTKPVAITFRFRSGGTTAQVKTK